MTRKISFSRLWHRPPRRPAAWGRPGAISPILAACSRPTRSRTRGELGAQSFEHSRGDGFRLGRGAALATELSRRARRSYANSAKATVPADRPTLFHQELGPRHRVAADRDGIRARRPARDRSVPRHAPTRIRRLLTDRVIAPTQRPRPLSKRAVAARGDGLLRAVERTPKPYRRSWWRAALNAVVRPLARLG